MVEIRDAQPADAVRLAEIHAMSWQAAYRDVLSQVFLEGLSATSRLEFWNSRLARVPPRWSVLVTEVDQEVTGFVTIGQCQDGDRNSPEAGELYAMYLDPPWWGSGQGRDLLLAAEERFVSDGYTHASLWVLRDNHRARRFYQMGSWKADGAEQRMVIGLDAVTALRYRKSLQSSVVSNQ